MLHLLLFPFIFSFTHGQRVGRHGKKKKKKRGSTTPQSEMAGLLKPTCNKWVLIAVCAHQADAQLGGKADYLTMMWWWRPMANKQHLKKKLTKKKRGRKRQTGKEEAHSKCWKRKEDDNYEYKRLRQERSYWILRTGKGRAWNNRKQKKIWVHIKRKIVSQVRRECRLIRLCEWNQYD